MSQSPLQECGLPAAPSAPIRVGISSCLLGEPVRYDGGHKRSSLCHSDIAGLFQYEPYCPEVAIGLPTPREPIRLLLEGNDEPGATDVVAVSDARKRFGPALRSYAGEVAQQSHDLGGYLFMKNSPSCGLHRVKRWRAGNEVPSRDGRGAFAEELLRLSPSLPTEEAGRMFDPALRENFVTRVFARAHFLSLLRVGVSARGLIEFHSQYKLLIMAHSPSATTSMGRMLSQLNKQPLLTTAHAYLRALMNALRLPATRRGHTNALQHLMGYVSQTMNTRSVAELAEVISSYHRGEVPLLAPITLLTHHLEQAQCEYGLKQRYLSPHPAWAGLRRVL